MKLLFCPHCNSVFNLTFDLKKCSCGKSYGRYIDQNNAEISETAVALGFKNSEFVEAMRDHIREPWGRLGKEFTAFVIPDNSESVIRKRVEDDFRLMNNPWVVKMADKIPTKKEEEESRMKMIQALHEACSEKGVDYWP